MASEKITGTKEAFTEMIYRRGIYKYLDVDRSTVANWKTLLVEGGITIDKMEEMLLKYGATVISEKKWKLPKL